MVFLLFFLYKSVCCGGLFFYDFSYKLLLNLYIFLFFLLKVIIGFSDKWFLFVRDKMM